MSLIISILFFALNGYFGYRAYKRQDWLWVGISAAFATMIAYDIGRVIL